MVKGPARVAVRGECFVLGAVVSNSVVTVRAGKVLPFETRPGCRLLLSRGARIRSWFASPHEAGTAIWRVTAQQVFSMAKRHTRPPFRIMIVGESDSGKSTICTYFSNLAICNGVYPVVIDGDIGQGDIAPPCSVGSAVLDSAVTDLRSVTATMFEFVGTISAAGVESEIATCLAAICQRSKNLSSMQIINTDGYVQDLGLSYKRLIAEQVEPDVIVCMGRNPELESALSGRWPVLRAKTSGQAIKSGHERRWRRYDQYLRFAGHGNEFRRVGDLQFFYFGKAVEPYESETLPPAVRTGGLDGLFVGLGTGRSISGFGIIRGVEGEEIEIQTETGVFDTVFLSNIRMIGTKAQQITA